jgi:formamidopyrimidine-DNA glycosylase
VLQLDVVRFAAPDEFVRDIAGAQIQAVQRRAKWLLIALDRARTLAIHFMLFGRLRLEPSDVTHEPNLQLALTLDDGTDLRLIDRLGYARAALLPNAELDSRLGLDSLGPEVLAPDFSPEVLGARLARKRIPIKPALLDQHVVAGMGNRDADESLWRAGIDPRRPAGSLADDELQRLTEAMREVLAEGIAHRGTMPDIWGKRGTSLDYRRVYEREGEPCARCGGPIARQRLGQRNGFYCPNCQPERAMNSSR